MPRNATSTFDGLVVGYGTHSSDNDTPGVQAGSGVVVVQTEIVGTRVPDTASATNGIATPQAHIIPRGALIVRATLVVSVAWTSGGAALLDVGLWSRGLATEVVDDADGLWDGGTVAELTTIGEVNVLDGALLPIADGVATGIVGRTANGDCVLTAEYETAAWTAGIAMLTVEYIPPFVSSGRVLAV